MENGEKATRFYRLSAFEFDTSSTSRTLNRIVSSTSEVSFSKKKKQPHFGKKNRKKIRKHADKEATET